MRALADDVESLCLVRECRELEEGFGTSYTDEILGCAEGTCLREVRDELVSLDRDSLLVRCEGKSKLIAEVGKGIGWARLWDSVMDLGVHHIRGLQALSRILSSHGHGTKPCPLCDIMDLDGELLSHILERHLQKWNKDSNSVMDDLQLANLNFLRMFHAVYVLL